MNYFNIKNITKIQVVSCIMLFIFLYVYFKNDKLEFFQSNKKIVSIYSPESYFGIGDYIRGIIYLYQNEKERDIFINYETNEISKYLYNGLQNTYKEIDECKILPTDELNYHLQIRNNKDDVIYVHNNAAITYPIKPDIINQIKKMFMMKPDMEKEFNDKLSMLTVDNNFVILHIRLDDDVFVNDTLKYFDRLINYIEEEIIPIHKSNVMVISNSTLTKEYICNRYNFSQFKIDPIHTGAVGKFSPDDIKDTLIEFFTISKSKHIYQFCETPGHISGFSKRIAEIYNINFDQIN